jgi:preprotein translocase subunit SecE
VTKEVNRIFEYLREVKAEMMKVIWPSRRETVRMTITVIIFSAAVAVFLGAIDYGLTKLVEVLVAS